MTERMSLASDCRNTCQLDPRAGCARVRQTGPNLETTRGLPEIHRVPERLRHGKVQLQVHT